MSVLRNLLHGVALWSSVENLKSLLDQGNECPDSKSKLYDGKTALHLAVLSGSEPKLRLLLERGASVNLTENDGKTALHVAFSRKNKELAEVLLEKGADVDCKDKNGTTPLHISACLQFISGLKILLAAGAEPNVKDYRGETPPDLLVYNQSLPDYYQSLLLLSTVKSDGFFPNAPDDYGQIPLQDCLISGLSNRTSHALGGELLAWRAEVEIHARTFKRYVQKDPCAPISQHFTKIECAKLNMDVRKHNFNSQHCFSDFRALCLKELEKIKAKRFGCFPLYDLFVKYNDPLYCLSKELEEATKPNASALDSEFPLYAPLLRARFFKAKQRLVLLNEAQSRVPFQVPNEIKRMILSLVDSEDLGNVVEAFGGGV